MTSRHPVTLFVEMQHYCAFTMIDLSCLPFCDFRIVYRTTCTYGCSSSSCSKIISMNSCVHSWMSATREHLQCRPRHISFFCVQNEQQSSWSECAAVDGLLSHSQRRTTLAWQQSIQKEAIPYPSLLWDSNLLIGSPKGQNLREGQPKKSLACLAVVRKVYSPLYNTLDELIHSQCRGFIMFILVIVTQVG